MRPMDVIPATRTSSPYSLTEAVSDLTTNIAGTDTDSLNQSLDTLSETLDQVAPQLGSDVRRDRPGCRRRSTTADDTLGALLNDGADVTKILSERSAQVNTLILNANDLLGVLNERRQAIVELLVHTSALAQQLSGLVARQRGEAGADAGQAQRGDGDPGEEPRQHRQGDTRAGEVPDHLGETVGNGPYYQAYVPNLFISQIFQPFFDYAFGFRRGTDAGQPPDNAGPRAELPFPYNGIPQPGEQWGPPPP